MNILKLIISLAIGVVIGYMLFNGNNSVTARPEIKPHSVNDSIINSTEDKNGCVNVVDVNDNAGTAYQSNDNQALTEISLPILFLPESEYIEAQSYSDLIAEVSSENAVLYENLNQNFFNAFTFSNKQELDRALANGFPSPQELEYVYGRDVDDLIDDIYLMRSKINLTSHPDFPKVEKLGVLTFNRALDDLISTVIKYRPDYQVGDPLTEFQQVQKGILPSDVEQAINRVMRLRGLATGNLASSYLVAARFNELNPYNYDKQSPDYTKLAQLVVAEVKLKTNKIRESVWPDKKDVPSEFFSMKAALYYIDLPNGRCPATND